MKNVELLFKNVEERRVDIKKNKIIISLEHKSINSKTLLYLARDFKFLLNYKFCKKEIYIKFGDTKFQDKITYLILDSMLYYILKNTQFSLNVGINVDLKNVHNMGFVGTALYNCLKDGYSINKDKFIVEYEKGFSGNYKVYRRFLTSEKLKESNKWPSIVFSEVAAILKECLEDQEWIDSISETVSELICNVSSHTDGDCFIHIDKSEDMANEKNGDEKYTSINIAVINFSENRLFDKIKENIKKNKFRDSDPLYNKIYGAYNTHKKLFNDEYKEDDFFFITAFQNHVTTRNVNRGNSGTGLTNLIETIIGKTDKDYSYVLSGENIVFFKPEYLALTDERFVGFNEQNNYFDCRPSKEIINRSNLYIPGSIYHLLLIKEC